MIRYFLNIILLVGAISCIAQNGSVRGHLLDSETGEPITFATVFIQPSGNGLITDVDGFFSISLPVGSYSFSMKYLGYDSLRISIDLSENEVFYKIFELTPIALDLSTVEVSAKQAIRKSETNLATFQINRKEISQLPSLSVQGDLAQYISVLPGVVTSGEQGGQIFISGGSPHQNMTFVDGINIVSPFHSLSGFSILPTEMIRNVEIKGAAFDASYGGRISSVMDVKLKNNLPESWGGSLSIDPFVGQAFIEGPVWRSSDNDQLGISLFVGGKKSIIDQSAESLYKFIDEGIPFRFEDLTGKLLVKTPSGNHFSVTGLFANDKVNLGESQRFNWTMNGGGFNFRLLPPRSSLVVNGQLSASNFKSNLNTLSPRTSIYDHFLAKLFMEYFGQKSQLTYGFQLEGARTDFTFLNFADISFNQQDNTSDISGFMSYNATLNKLIFESGIRVIYYASIGNFSVEPRLALKYNVGDKFRLKAGAGRYSQNFILARKDEDIVNFFSAFLSSPDGQLPKLDGSIAKTNLQIALHGLIGFEVDLNRKWSLDGELYVKKFDQLIELNRNKITSGDRDYVVENGESVGANFVLEYDSKPFRFYANYSWLKSVRNNGTQTYPAHFDRRHQVTGWLNYSWKKNWNISLRWSLGSGFPFTRTQGFFDRILFEDGIGEDLITVNGDLGIIYEDDLNQGRLPYYHRLDISVKRRWKIKELTTLDLGLSLINIYDRDNIFYFDRLNYTRVDQFPFIPSLGLKLTF